VPAGASEGLGTAAGPVMNGADAARQWLARAVVLLAADRSDAVRRAAWGALEGDTELQAQFLAQLPARVEQPFAPEVGAALDAGLAHPVRGLRVHTDLGSFVIEFEGAPSPVAAANLVALAKAGTFDGLRFHRVVPGFVAQGGDPHGDGYGGPGWVLPCEWSDLRYERGTVGMALAGKDTGGSQFFIAQTRQPHLDGRFTVVGRVREGLDLVDRLLPHDRIVRVEVVERDGATP
jgi:cyclophilin family peptidyl-prolyl cis-trans isomerase